VQTTAPLSALQAVVPEVGITWQDEGQGRYSALYDCVESSPRPELVAQLLRAVPVEDLELRSASMEDVVRDLYERQHHG
jgi:ABC-2 type transport system ATP-binding protein